MCPGSARDLTHNCLLVLEPSQALGEIIHILKKNILYHPADSLCLRQRGPDGMAKIIFSMIRILSVSDMLLLNFM